MDDVLEIFVALLSIAFFTMCSFLFFAGVYAVLLSLFVVSCGPVPGHEIQRRPAKTEVCFNRTDEDKDRPCTSEVTEEEE